MSSLIVASGIITLLNHVIADNPLLTTANATFPGPSAIYRSAVYDNKDSIYVFGSFVNNSIWKYSISKDTLEPVGTLPSPYFGGVAVFAGSEDIYYFGGLDSTLKNGQSVFKFTPKLGGEAKKVGEIPNTISPNFDNTAIWDGKETIYYFASEQDPNKGNVTLYNISTNTTTTMPYPLKHPSGVMHDDGNIYTFGGFLNTSSNAIYKLSTNDKKVQELESVLLYPTYASSVIRDNRTVYILGGSSLNATIDTAIVRFNLNTMVAEKFEVDEFPTNLAYAASVFVKSLKRIYIFPGYCRKPPGECISSKSIYFFDL